MYENKKNQFSNDNFTEEKKCLSQNQKSPQLPHSVEVGLDDTSLSKKPSGHWA